MSFGTKIFYIILTSLFVIINIGYLYIKISSYIIKKDAKKIYYDIISNYKTVGIKNTSDYISKIDFYTFKELILFIFKKKGYTIKINKQYYKKRNYFATVIFKKEKFLLYGKNGIVSKYDINSFSTECRNKQMKGFFISIDCIDPTLKEKSENVIFLENGYFLNFIKK